jgi:hypothetical protein
LFIVSRKNFHKLMLIGALSIASGVVLRLFSLRSTDATELVSEAYFLVAIGVVYGLVWLGARYLGEGERSRTHKNR